MCTCVSLCVPKHVLSCALSPSSQMGIALSLAPLLWRPLTLQAPQSSCSILLWPWVGLSGPSAPHHVSLHFQGPDLLYTTPPHQILLALGPKCCLPWAWWWGSVSSASVSLCPCVIGGFFPNYSACLGQKESPNMLSPTRFLPFLVSCKVLFSPSVGWLSNFRGGEGFGPRKKGLGRAGSPLQQ